jgi:hypothetical protein
VALGCPLNERFLDGEGSENPSRSVGSGPDSLFNVPTLALPNANLHLDLSRFPIQYVQLLPKLPYFLLERIASALGYFPSDHGSSRVDPIEVTCGLVAMMGKLGQFRSEDLLPI